MIASMTTKGPDLDGRGLPKIAISVRGGRLLGLFGLFGVAHMTAIIGSEWRKGDLHRLYGTLANPKEGTFDLGYVDLADGTIHPKADKPLSRDRGPAARYLAILRDRYPQREG